MTNKIFNKWMKTIEKINKNLKLSLEKGEITEDIYIILNRINLDKYNQIVKLYHQEKKQKK